MHQDKALRAQLVRLLTARQAHADFADATANFPAAEINARAPNCSYSFWGLIEHMRLAQKDILEYIVAAEYTWPTFPDDYWPDITANASFELWRETIKQFLADRQALVSIVQDPAVDLFAPLPNSGEHQHSILREINVIASHNAYHTGELVILRRLIGAWPPQP